MMIQDSDRLTTAAKAVVQANDNDALGNAEWLGRLMAVIEELRQVLKDIESRR